VLAPAGIPELGVFAGERFFEQLELFGICHDVPPGHPHRPCWAAV
jgi:hypothetical protein